MSQRGLMGSATSLTNLTSEPDFFLPRCRSASEIYDPSSDSGSRRSKAKHRAKDIRHSIADSRSDYYNNRRPQSMSLSSQIPAFSNLQSASSVLALGTISENEALRSSPHTPFSSQTGRDSIFAEPPETPIFNYNPTSLPSVEASTPTRVSSSAHQQQARLSQTSFNQGPQMTGSGNRTPNGYADSHTTAPVHVSELVAQEFVPIYLNPHTGQMYSHSHNYFRPIAGINDIITPPKPDRRLEEEDRSQSSYIRFTQFLAILFFICGNMFVVAACSLPALFCAHKVEQLNLQKRYREARKRSEYVMCFNVLGIVLHIMLMLAAIITAVVVAAVVLG